MKSKPVTQRSLVAAAVCLALHAGGAGALEMGVPTVASGLGERLAATIPLSSARALAPNCVSVTVPAGVPAVSAKLAGGSLMLTSRAPIREPILDLVVRAGCGGDVTLIRTYSLLLDLPLIDGPGYAITPAPVIERMSSRRERNSRAPTRSVSRDTLTGPRYRVRRGDTLSEIAARIDDPGRSLWAKVDALFSANPDAFIGGDPDRLKAGALLILPGEFASSPVDAATSAAPAVPSPDAASDASAANAAPPASQSLAPPTASPDTVRTPGRDYADTVFSVINGSAGERQATEGLAGTTVTPAATPIDAGAAERSAPAAVSPAVTADRALPAPAAAGSGWTAWLRNAGIAMLIAALAFYGLRRAARRPAAPGGDDAAATQGGKPVERERALRDRLGDGIGVAALQPATATTPTPVQAPVAPQSAAAQGTRGAAAAAATQQMDSPALSGQTPDDTTIDVRAIPEFTATMTLEAPQGEEQSLLEQDYEEEFSRTQQMRKQLAAQAMKQSLAALTGDADARPDATAQAVEPQADAGNTQTRRLADNLTDELFDSLQTERPDDDWLSDTAPLQPIVHDECTESTVALPGPMADDADDVEDTYIDDRTLELLPEDESDVDDGDKTIATRLDEATRDLESALRSPRKKRA